MTYYLVTRPHTPDVILRVDSDGSELWIPVDDGNSDYQAYQEWLAEGNTPEPWPPAEA